jgi:hypothetical protein
MLSPAGSLLPYPIFAATGVQFTFTLVSESNAVQAPGDSPSPRNPAAAATSYRRVR